MKTLDEVIWAVENCDSAIDDCAHCAYYKEDCENLRPLRADALHYLKEYRSEKAMWEADRKGYLDWIEQYKEAREKHQQAVIELKKNPPLTFEELKAMQGKPVWVEYAPKRFPALDSCWGIATTSFTSWEGSECWTLVRPGAEYVTPVSEYGKTWQAYRKEREA